jgi:hypothetical protein
MSHVFLKYALSCQHHFSYFDLDYPKSGLTYTGLAMVHCHVYEIWKKTIIAAPTNMREDDEASPVALPVVTSSGQSSCQKRWVDDTVNFVYLVHFVLGKFR